MEDVNVPGEPNPFITEWLLGYDCWRLMWARAIVAEALYVERVAKVTHQLAESARIEMHIGGYKRNDRWCARMIVGEPPRYAASHEFGIHDRYKIGKKKGQIKKRKRTKSAPRNPRGARDLNAVLNLLASS